MRIDDEVNLKSVYNSSKFESDQFIRFVFSILNVNSKRRRNKPSLRILDWTDINLDLNPFRRRDLRISLTRLFNQRDFGNEDDDLN